MISLAPVPEPMALGLAALALLAFVVVPAYACPLCLGGLVFALASLDGPDRTPHWLSVRRICRGEALAAGIPEDRLPLVEVAESQHTPSTQVSPEPHCAPLVQGAPCTPSGWHRLSAVLQ